MSRPDGETQPLDGITQNVGYVHVGKSLDGPFECADDCPHPDHFGSSRQP